MKGNFAGETLFVYAPNKYTVAADAWKTKFPEYSAQLRQLGSYPKPDWIAHEDAIPNIGRRLDDAAKLGHLASFVWYLITGRDLGSHSAGGAESAEEYRRLYKLGAAQIKGRKCIIDFEPDALPMINRMSDADEAARYQLMSEARAAFEQAGAVVYVHAGVNSWIEVDEIVERLARVGAKNFSLNTSTTQLVADEHAYAQAIRAKSGIDLHYIIDTGRAGRGPFDQYAAKPGDAWFVAPDAWDFEDAHWLNAPGRGIGPRPTVNVSQAKYPGCDAYLWTKGPGGRDGPDSRLAPNAKAGDFAPWEALALRQRARPAFPDPT